LLVGAYVNVVGHLCKAGVEGSIPFVSTAVTSYDARRDDRTCPDVTRNEGGALPLDTFDEDLGDRLAREQVLAPAVAVDVLEQVASASGARAHQA
jgi:hypothetical protein